MRDLEKEKAAVGEFGKITGRMPSSSEDWAKVHQYAYGSNVPDELKSLPINNASPDAQNGTVVASSGESGSLPFRGADISDTALQGARNEYFSYNQSGFLDKVKQRLQQKFKPESETLGLSSYAQSLGPLDPNGVMKGIADKSGQFQRKGALALKALSTANDIYSEQANRAYEKLSMLNDMRDIYEQNQKETEMEVKSMALEMIKSGKDVPEDLLNLLPQDMRDVYAKAGKMFKNELAGDDATGGSLNMYAQAVADGDLSRTDLSAMGFSAGQIRSIMTESLGLTPSSGGSGGKLEDYFSPEDIRKLRRAGLENASLQDQINFIDNSSGGGTTDEDQKKLEEDIDKERKNIINLMPNDLTWEEAHNRMYQKYKSFFDKIAKENNVDPRALVDELLNKEAWQ